jgi:uncharacterized protein YggE
MRQRWMAVGLAAVAATVGGAVLGSAGAQEPAASSSRLVTVTGAGDTRVAVNASGDALRTAYRSALGEALDDAKGKAGFIAQQTSLTLGSVQSVTEQTSTPTVGACAIAEAKALGRPARRPRKLKATTPKPGAHPAQAEPTTCDVTAAVTVAYAVTG